MTDSVVSKIYGAKMSDADFKKLSSFIYSEYGIKMPDVKKTMLQSRLQKRLVTTQITSFKEYIEYVFSKEGKQTELIHMIDVVTTNKTDFFREPVHFDFLQEVVLPDYYQAHKRKIMDIWAAGCSSGEEPYTLAIVLAEFAEQHQGFDFRIYATDISTRILKRAMEAIYSEEKTSMIPMYLKKKYLLKSKDPTKKLVRISQLLRKKITFSRLNFMDATYDVPYIFDAIFCRNVIIYFDRETQEKVINKLSRNLSSSGYFFLGHSESIANMNVPLRHIKPTIFKKTE
jgi:chemotaxis protein methyltransferase CheR